MMNDKNMLPLVSIICMTYNQAPYIRKTLEGFVMQDTSFKFEAFIHDDASTDNTRDVIKEFEERYPDIIKPIYEKENQYSLGVDTIAKIIDERCRGRYIAFCEGDDYWVDSKKLQKQVDILDTSPNVTCVHTGFYTIDKDGNKITRPFYEKCMRVSHNKNALITLLNGNYVMHLTTLYRKEVFFSDIYKGCPSKFDYTMTFAAALLGNLVYLPEKTSCYRRTPGSSMEKRHNDENHPLRKMGMLNYSYFAKQIILRTDFCFWDKLLMREHILVYLLRIKDIDTINYILGKDRLSLFLYPFARIFKKLKYSNN